MTKSQDVSMAETLASILRGAASFKENSVAHGISVRVPITLLSSVDAISDLADMSRNKACIMLLRIGIEELVSKLDDDSHERYTLKQGELLLSAIDRGDCAETFDSEESE